MSVKKDIREVFDSCPFAEEIRLFNFVANLEAQAELEKALCEQRLMELGQIPKELTFRRPDLHINFRMYRTPFKA